MSKYNVLPELVFLNDCRRKIPAYLFNVAVLLKDPKTGLPMKDLRVSLKSNHTELESYVCQAGSVVFEHVFLGRYAIEITNLTAKLAAVIVEIKR